MKNDEEACIEWHFIVKAQLPLLNDYFLTSLPTAAEIGKLSESLPCSRDSSSSSLVIFISRVLKVPAEDNKNNINVCHRQMNCEIVWRKATHSFIHSLSSPFVVLLLLDSIKQDVSILIGVNTVEVRPLWGFQHLHLTLRCRRIVP